MYLGQKKYFCGTLHVSPLDLSKMPQNERSVLKMKKNIIMGDNCV